MAAALVRAGARLGPAGAGGARAEDFKTYVDQACRAAEEFVNIYYETMDKRRRVLTRLYLDKATLVWNGNAVSGQEALNEFFEMLPSSEFQINVLDCQPVHGRLHGGSSCRGAVPNNPSSQPRATTPHTRVQRCARGALHTWYTCGLLWKSSIQVRTFVKEMTAATQITSLCICCATLNNNSLN
ncbi:NTF2-related export protein 2 isoform X1 [Anas platyrhynchos]|uniref:NTF2-related export protein 2 isoform X1 n=1 Tax=Anas platyrhynchos TaxID=8839 RepID=UPI0018D98C6B|nr:NTF2-related export protein 2 isoform X1 [Anas platyrhynchos]